MNVKWRLIMLDKQNTYEKSSTEKCHPFSTTLNTRLTIYYDVKRSFGFSTAKGPEDSKDLGKFRVTDRFLRSPPLDSSIGVRCPLPFVRFPGKHNLGKFLREKKIRVRGGTRFRSSGERAACYGKMEDSLFLMSLKLIMRWMRTSDLCFYIILVY